MGLQYLQLEVRQPVSAVPNKLFGAEFFLQFNFKWLYFITALQEDSSIEQDPSISQQTISDLEDKEMFLR